MKQTGEQPLLVGWSVTRWYLPESSHCVGGVECDSVVPAWSFPVRSWIELRTWVLTLVPPTHSYNKNHYFVC